MGLSYIIKTENFIEIKLVSTRLRIVAFAKKVITFAASFARFMAWQPG